MCMGHATGECCVLGAKRRVLYIECCVPHARRSALTQQEGSKRGQWHTVRGGNALPPVTVVRGGNALPPLTVCHCPLLLPLRPSYCGPLPPPTVCHVPLLLCAIAPSYCVLLPPLTECHRSSLLLCATDPLLLPLPPPTMCHCPSFCVCHCPNIYHMPSDMLRVFMAQAWYGRGLRKVDGYLVILVLIELPSINTI